MTTVSHGVVEEQLCIALDALQAAGLAGEITPWALRDGTVIGVRVAPTDGATPLSIDMRAPRGGAVAHPGACAAEDSGLYRLHARLYGEGCTAQCLADHPSVAHFAAVRLAPALAATLLCAVEDIQTVMEAAARPHPGTHDAPCPIRPLSEVLFAA